MKAAICISLLLLTMTSLPQALTAETAVVRGPSNITMPLEAVCAKRNLPAGQRKNEPGKRPIWIDCETEGRHITLMIAELSRVRTHWNDFSSNKTDNIFDEITLETEWYQLRDRLRFWGGTFREGSSSGGFMSTIAWICPEATRRCGKPAQLLDLKVVGNRSATVALLTVGDFETIEQEAADGKPASVRWDFPPSVRAMIDSFDFEK
jgi:hypothetical protein